MTGAPTFEVGGITSNLPKNVVRSSTWRVGFVAIYARPSGFDGTTLKDESTRLNDSVCAIVNSKWHSVLVELGESLQAQVYTQPYPIKSLNVMHSYYHQILRLLKRRWVQLPDAENRTPRWCGRGGRRNPATSIRSFQMCNLNSRLHSIFLKTSEVRD